MSRVTAENKNVEVDAFCSVFCHPVLEASGLPPSQAAKMLLMSGRCVQSPGLPGRTGFHSISPRIRSSNIHVLTVASVMLHYIDSWHSHIKKSAQDHLLSTSYANEDRSKPCISSLACAAFKISLNVLQISYWSDNASTLNVISKRQVRAMSWAIAALLFQSHCDLAEQLDPTTSIKPIPKGTRMTQWRKNA